MEKVNKIRIFVFGLGHIYIKFNKYVLSTIVYIFYFIKIFILQKKKTTITIFFFYFSSKHIIVLSYICWNVNN